jgi:hypothetical protein
MSTLTINDAKESQRQHPLPDDEEERTDIMSSTELRMNASDMTDISNVEVSLI